MEERHQPREGLRLTWSVGAYDGVEQPPAGANDSVASKTGGLRQPANFRQPSGLQTLNRYAVVEPEDEGSVTLCKRWKSAKSPQPKWSRRNLNPSAAVSASHTR